MGKSDGKVTISTALDNKGLQKGIGNISGSLGGLKSVVGKLGGAIAAAFSIKAIVQFGVESSKAAMQLSDALTGLKSILDGQGRSFSSAKVFLEDYVKDGLIPMTNAAAAYKNLAMRGYDDSQIQKTLIALKNASAYGRQASLTMGEAVQSATEGLKNENSILVDNAGVTKNVAKMWDEYAKSIGTTANNLTQQQKIQAEVTGILEESKYQTGDAAKVAGTLSGQLQQLSFNFNNLKIAVGNIVNPIVQYFLPAINTAISAVTRFANAIATTVGSIFGKVVVQTTAIGESASAGAAAQEDLADGVTKAGKAAKKSLASFDELNILQSPDSGSGSASTGTGSAPDVSVGTIAASSEVQDNITPKIQALIEKIKGFSKEIKTAFLPSISAWSKAFSNLGPSVESAGKRIGAAWTTLKDKALLPFGTYITTDFIPSIVNDFNTTFAPIFAEVMPVAMDIWTTDFENSCLLIQEYCGILQTAYEGIQTTFSDMCESISTNWDTYGGDLLQGFTDFKNGLWETWWYIYNNIIDPVVTWCGESFDWVWKKHLKPLWDNIVEFISSVSENILALWNGFLKPVIDWIIAFLAPVVVNAIGLIVDWVGYAVGLIADVIGGIITILDGIIQFVVGVFTLDWKRAWGGIVKVFKGLWEGLVGIVKGVANAVIWAINALIAALYSAIAGVVNGVGSIVKSFGELLGKDWGFSMPTETPKIPYLAQGAVLPANKPFLAMVGDQKHGTNIEAPLDTIKQALAEVMETGGIGDITVNFTGDLAQLARVLNPVIEIEGRRVGGSLVRKAGT